MLRLQSLSVFCISICYELPDKHKIPCVMLSKYQCLFFIQQRIPLHHLPDRIWEINFLFIDDQHFIFVQAMNAHRFRPEEISPATNYAICLLVKHDISVFAFQHFPLILYHPSRT